MTDAATMRGVPTRDFTDAGTGQSFAKDVADSFEPGVYANYHAAGLIDGPAPEIPAPADPDA